MYIPNFDIIVLFEGKFETGMKKVISFYYEGILSKSLIQPAFCTKIVKFFENKQKMRDREKLNQNQYCYFVF